ncbi:hypothetical protein [Paenibacillus sp. GbtcB18]|uniref:TolB family protein n=1 Tax=Paenibacillus sp. GbtcB18 TaxID=2824763 RepID=UPI0020C701A3|nr:hypothetical protein [Paenibacillus sp. GbtcB18]
MMKRRSMLSLPLLLAALALLAGCAGSPTAKTIVMGDTAEEAHTEEESTDFETNKIYKLALPGNKALDVWGWMSSRLLLGSYKNQETKQDIQLVDYRNLSAVSLTPLAGDAQTGKPSPDGKYMAYTGESPTGETLYILDLNTSQSFAPGIPDKGKGITSAMTWSNNGRYLSFTVKSREYGTESIVVYDMNSRTSQEIPLPRWQENSEAPAPRALKRDSKYTVISVKFADDGSTALMGRIGEDGSYVTLGAVTEDKWTRKFEHSASERQFDYVNDSQIIFLDAKNTLTLYDERDENTVALSAGVSTFRLSGDNKTIAYAKDEESLYVAKLQGHNMIKEKLVYKGLVLSQMDWSPDNKKILITGWKSYDRAPATGNPEQTPLVIEFK